MVFEGGAPLRVHPDSLAPLLESEGERMLEPPLVITVSDLGATTTVCIAGEIDVATSPQIDEVLKRCDSAPVRVDLAAVTFMDSSGIAVLARAHERAAAHHFELTIANATPHVRRLFAITGLEEMLASESVGIS